jgi:hypothetical protein
MPVTSSPTVAYRQAPTFFVRYVAVFFKALEDLCIFGLGQI